MATLLSAWSGLQSSLWGGVQDFRLNDSLTQGRQATATSALAVQERAFDAQLFFEFLEMRAEGRTEMAAYLHKGMRPEARVALDAWLAKERSRAPVTPFAMPEYKLRAESRAAALNEQSARSHDQANDANKASDSYTILIVAYSAVLFFAGMVSNFRAPRSRWTILLLAGCLLIAATIMLARLPVASAG